jgi:hypothetical protein
MKPEQRPQFIQQAMDQHHGPVDIHQEVDRLKQQNPAAAQTPQGFGQLWNQASQSWQGMPTATKAMVGVGVPVAAAGLMSSASGGGVGMGVLGALGLGAAGAGAAAGGLFGQGGQHMAGDALYNLGTFTGMMPEKADLSVLKGTNPLANLDSQSGNLSRDAVSQQLAAGRDNAANLKKLMSLPVGDDVKIRLMQRLDPSISSPDAGRQALTNAGTLLQAFDDPNSSLSKKMQAGDWYANSAKSDNWKDRWGGWAAEKIGPSRLQGLSNWWSGKQGAVAMQHDAIQKLISVWAEKTALNDVDAKELQDLQVAQSQQYDLKNARRLQELQTRQQAAAPQPELTQEMVAAACQKAARCWSGYEPVPGAKKFSKGSCRPKGSKKTQKEMKKS